ncbi:hypothetical protein BDQ17DRAFT_1245663 [Cyathus striatus]|nr:hypothetical protein BDQ17DRAFT_1245663 [Cyathus striatus]
MSAESQPPTPPQASTPEFTVLSRVASIPMISSSLETINGALSSNAYTRNPYSTAKELSSTAYKYTEPLQVRLAPLIVRADGYANAAVDAVESRYPYPFKVKPEDVVSLVQESKESASNYVHERVNEANKAIDEKVKAPAYNVVQGIDHRFAPIVDYFEVAIARLNSGNGTTTPEAGPSSPTTDTKYQYQRAIALTRTLRSNLYGYSTDQLKELHAHSVLLQRATETANSITQLATTSLNTAQSRIHALSDTMLLELQKLQTSTAQLSASLQHSAQAQVPAQLQQTYAELSTGLTGTVGELRSIISADLSLQEKVGKVRHEVVERVTPLLDGVKKSVSDVLAKAKYSEPPTPTEEENGTAANEKATQPIPEATAPGPHSYAEVTATGTEHEDEYPIDEKKAEKK